jgi:hypothetical protein
MSPRDTGTGRVLEEMILPSLRRNGFTHTDKPTKIGTRFGGGAHYVDVIAEKDGQRILVSLKWQQVEGTAEQKVPFEVICLADAVMTGGFSKAYLVLGGEGWKLRTFYTSGGLRDQLVHADKVEILTLEGFVAKANRGLI